MSAVVAGLMFGSLLSPPLLLLLVVIWALGGELLLVLPIVVWAASTVWMAVNVAIRQLRRRDAFYDALVQAPVDAIDQLARLLRLKRRGLRPV